MWQDFKEFIMQGNVLNLAIGVVMGTAFKDIVNALVDYIITPIIAGLSGNASVEYMTISIGPAEIGVGMFLQAIIDFFFIAIILFFIVKGVSSVVSRFEKEEEEELEPTPEEYLAEIRDILAASSDYSTSKVDQTAEGNISPEDSFTH